LNTHGIRLKDIDKLMRKGTVNIRHFIGSMLKIGAESNFIREQFL